MMNFALSVAFGVLTVSILLGLVRLARGPSVIDRVLAFDLIATCAVGMIVLLSIQWRTSLYLELLLIFSLLGFLTTVAFVFHLHRTIQPAAEPKSGSAPSVPRDRSESHD